MLGFSKLRESEAVDAQEYVEIGMDVTTAIIEPYELKCVEEKPQKKSTNQFFYF